MSNPDDPAPAHPALLERVRAAVRAVEDIADDLTALAAVVVPVVPRIYYFGCGKGRAGHQWCSRDGGYDPDDRLTDRMPYALHHVDGGYAPMTSNRGYQREELPQGVYRHLIIQGWSVLSWWDRSQDPRGACNSTIAARGVFPSEVMLAAARDQYPWVFERMKFEMRPEPPFLRFVTG